MIRGCQKSGRRVECEGIIRSVDSKRDMPRSNFLPWGSISFMSKYSLKTSLGPCDTK